MDKETTCCFTGHRPSKLPWGQNENDPRCVKVKQELASRLEGIYEMGFRHFMCGMAIGCDMYFAEAVLNLRDRHPDVSLEAVIPCGTQPDRWAKPLRMRYTSLLDRCDSVKVLQIMYSRDCMMRRNKYMVDNSSLLLGCFMGLPGGTMNTIVYAERSGLKVVLIEI